METEGPAPSDGEVGEHPDRLPSENRIGRRTDMEKTKNVRMRGLTPLHLSFLFEKTYIVITFGLNESFHHQNW